MTLKRDAGRTREHSLDDVEEGLKQGHADVIRVDLEVEQHGEAVRLRRRRLLGEAGAGTRDWWNRGARRRSARGEGLTMERRSRR